jgi:serine/threonine protein phosphatase PrpC
MSDVQAQLKITGVTDTGRRRTQNEDHIDFDGKLGIAVLADGMGGHKAGEIAAFMAVESVLEDLQHFINQENSQSITSSQLLEALSNTISDSNKKIFRAAEASHELKGMGTTVVAVVVRGSRIFVGHVGDSRLYLFRNNVLTRLTRDHSLIQDLIDKGFYTELEARTASVSHVVTRALGSRADVEVETGEYELEGNDLLLLCSDGLTDLVFDTKITDILSRHPKDLEKTAQALVAQANDHGGKDNISVIVARTSI